jgi:methionyl-tRNA formyltransferase
VCSSDLAFDPFPGAVCTLRGQTVKLWRARLADWPGRAPCAAGDTAAMGPDRLYVACGTGALELLELQQPGGRRMGVGAFLATPLGRQLAGR